MRFVANSLNGNFLKNILPGSDDRVDYVMAAIAYGSEFERGDTDLVDHCVDNRYRLDIWMRYDHRVPVSPSFLKKIYELSSDNVFCKLIPDCLHSKIIWWKGYGAYIGSANHSTRAWLTNIETGIFLTESELQMDDTQLEIEAFFESLNNIQQSVPLSTKIINELEGMARIIRNSNTEAETHNLRSVPFWGGPAFIDTQTRSQIRKDQFKREWISAMAFLRVIGESLANNRPSWIDPDVHIGWQIDQFLHAYYFNKVGNSNSKPYEDYFKKNRSNPQAALNEALVWWKLTSEAPSNENVTLYESAPFIETCLRKENVLKLTESEFSQICAYTHATKDHLVKMNLSIFGISDRDSLSRKDRIPIFANWLLKQTNKKGWNVLELINYVLYGGEDNDLCDRLYRAAREPDYVLPHYGINSIAEIAGWARPSIATPRNGRTSKALRSLGYSVHIY